MASTREDGINDGAFSSHPVDSILVRYLGSRHRISSSHLQLFLDLLNDPLLDRSLLNFRLPEDILICEASINTSLSANRSKSAATLRNFPPIVIDTIVNHVEALDSPEVATSGSVRNRGPCARRSGEVLETLLSMTLVHPSWTWPAQKAYGRELYIIVRNSHDLRLWITWPLLGPWTRRVVLLYNAFNGGTRWDHRTQPKPAQDTEAVRLMRLLLRRMSNITSLTLGLGICKEAANACWSSMFSSLASLKRLESLSLLHTCTRVPRSFAYHVSHLLDELPRLESLSVKSYDFNLEIEDDENENENAPDDPEDVRLNTRPRPMALTSVHLVIGPRIPMDFAVWLLNAHKYVNDGGSPESQIHHLSLSVARHEFNSTLPALTRIVAAINSTQTFAALHTLGLDFQYMSVTNDLLITLLRACQAGAPSLRELSITHKHNILPTILENLPSSLCAFSYSTEVSDMRGVDRAMFFPNAVSVEIFEALLVEFLLVASFRSQYPSLRLISLRLENVKPDGAVWSLEILRRGMPGLRDVVAAVRRVGGLELEVKWTSDGVREFFHAGPEQMFLGVPEDMQNQNLNQDQDQANQANALVGAFPLQLNNNIGNDAFLANDPPTLTEILALARTDLVNVVQAVVRGTAGFLAGFIPTDLFLDERGEED